MKVTVCFGKTGIVVPCKDGKINVRELIQQAAQRYIKATEKEPGYWVKIHHLEYKDGGILDPDDVVSDVVEDKDKLIAVFDEQDSFNRADDASIVTDRLSPDHFETESQHLPLRGEIEVTPSALKLGTPLLVRRSSDPSMGPVADFHPGSTQSVEQNVKLATQGRPAVLTEDQRDLTWQEEHVILQRPIYINSGLTKKVEISGDDGPLGIHVVPFYSSYSGRALGLFIRGIEENSRTKRDGLFQENECIVKINAVELMDKSFTQAQDIFRKAMKHPSVLVEVVPSPNRELYEKATISSLPELENHDDEDDEIPNIKPPPPPIHGKLNTKMIERSNGLESAQPLHPSLVSDLTSHGAYSPPSLSPLGFGSKRYNKRIRIDLKKGPDGLGFTVVTRDSTVHLPGPIFVKNILPKGAAIKDGRLQSGDQIIEVKGQAIAGKTQEELVAILRSTKLGETVSLVVARQEDAFLPRELQKGESEIHVVSPEKVAQMTFEIPLNDSGSAGLGISLKGNKSKDTSTDLGIFIKSIIHGGAAFKDGRLRVNDQLLAVNGESLLGKSNREAMETLRRSMSMEGNIRGMIQLVILRKLDKQMEDRSESEPVIRGNRENLSIEYNGLQDKMKGPANFDDRFLEKDIHPSLRPNSKETIRMEYSNFSAEMESSDAYNLKTSKSMDLVADESNIASVNGHKEVSFGKDLGPRLGLKKSSSLESLQTAVAEVKKNELPFYRPRPNMVRGRGCNESFRTAIDKSYDGPESEEDGLSDVSSHSDRETPTSEPTPLGYSEVDDADKGKKDKKKKDKKKEKEKEKGKSKVKDKKKKEESEEQEKKAKKKGFGAMLRFGKKNKDDKGGKIDQKGSPRPGTVREEDQEVDKMREERDRINARHQEIREKQAKVLWNFSASNDIEDDDMDPNYARVNHFKEPPPSQHNSHRPYSPAMPGSYSYPRETLLSASERDHVQDLYAKINKKQQAPDTVDSGHSTSGNVDRIQQLRMEYQQAKREGFSLYESEDVAERFLEYEQSWVTARGHSGSRNLSFEGIEQQYASLPRPGPVEPVEYMTSPRALYRDREPPYYYDVASPNTKGTYPRSQTHQEDSYRFPPYHPPTTKGPLRQDVPPSPPQPHRLPGYGTGGRSRQDRTQYRTQDPRQKNPMTAAV